MGIETFLIHLCKANILARVRIIWRFILVLKIFLFKVEKFNCSPKHNTCGKAWGWNHTAFGSLITYFIHMMFSFCQVWELRLCKSILELNKTFCFFSLTVYRHLGKCIARIFYLWKVICLKELEEYLLVRSLWSLTRQYLKKLWSFFQWEQENLSPLTCIYYLHKTDSNVQGPEHC